MGERTIFTVTPTGIGRPDYTPAVAASKLITDPLQTTFSWHRDTQVLAGGVGGDVIYVVPTGYKWTLGSVVISCDASIIQKLVIYRRLDGVDIYDLLDQFLYDTRGEVVFSAQNAVEAPERSQILVAFYNNDIVTRRITVNIQGFIQRVS